MVQVSNQSDDDHAGAADAGAADAGAADAGAADASRTDASRTDASRTAASRADAGGVEAGETGATVECEASDESSCCCASGLQEFLSPQLFKALADPRRLSLLVRLADEGRPCTVSQIADGSGVDLSVVSRHLAILRDAGVIRCEKQGKEVRCMVQTGAVAQILRSLAGALEACCPAGDPSEDTGGYGQSSKKG